MPRRSVPNVEERIIEISTELILEHGIVGLRIRDVAERANVSVSMIYRRFTDRDGLLDATVASFYESRIRRVVEQARELAVKPGSLTVEDIIAALPMPDFPGSKKTSSLMARVPALASENEIFRQRIQGIIEEQFPILESAIKKIIARLPSDQQFDHRILTILLLNQSWVYNDLRGSRRVSNDEYQDFLRGLLTGRNHR